MPESGADVPLDEGWRKIVNEAMKNPTRTVVSVEWVVHSLHATRIMEPTPYALRLDEHVLRRIQATPPLPSPEQRLNGPDFSSRQTTVELAVKDEDRKNSTVSAPEAIRPQQEDKAVSTEDQPVKRRMKRASEPLAITAPNAVAGPSRRRPGRPSMKARQSMPAIPTKRARRDTTDSELTMSSAGSNYSPHTLSPYEIRPTLRSDLKKVVDKERDAFLGIQPERSKKKARLEREWGRIEELDEVQKEDEMEFEVLTDSLKIWIEDNNKKERGQKEIFNKQSFLADLQERVSWLCGFWDSQL